MTENARAPQWTISEVGRRIGLRSSTLRYYEQIGIIPPVPRIAGQRRYTEESVYRVAAIKRARTLGFSIAEIRSLFFAFSDAVPAAPRWKQLAQGKLAELTRLLDAITSRQALLQDQGNCSCATLEECGKCIVESSPAEPYRARNTNR